jgi:hypothetical protein
LLPQAAAGLNSGGYLLMEISPQIHESVGTLIRARNDMELLPTID